LCGTYSNYPHIVLTSGKITGNFEALCFGKPKNGAKLGYLEDQ